MTHEVKEELRVRTMQVIFDIAAVNGGVKKLCKEFGIARSTYYYWKKRYENEGKSGLYRHKPIPNTSPRKTDSTIADKVVELRREYNMGPMKIVYYLQRYHDISISESTAYRILKAHRISRLSRDKVKRTTHSKRYSKSVPGHHVQVDVKFLFFKDLHGKRIKRFQYTAIDDATRIRALKIYNRHTQKNAIDFIDFVVNKFPFHIKTMRTDRGHEFQAKLHWHVENSGMEHVYIKPMTPQLNGKVERSHRTDKDEFYQLLSYTDDVDLSEKLQAWENYYNFDRPHFSHLGKTPYEIMKLLLIKAS